MRKRIFSIMLALCMMLCMFPASAMAETTCTHHKEHTAECGYEPAGECTHTHTEECYQTVTDYTTAVQYDFSLLVCAHKDHAAGEVDNCGFSAGSPCVYDYANCAECSIGVIDETSASGAEVNEKVYETLEEAVTAIKDSGNNGTIKLTKNFTISNTIITEAANGKTLTINLNGYEITSDKTVFNNNCILKIEDSSDAKSGKITSTGYEAITNHGRLEIEGGTIKGAKAAIYDANNSGYNTITNATLIGDGTSEYTLRGYSDGQANNAAYTITAPVTIKNKSTDYFINRSTEITDLNKVRILNWDSLNKTISDTVDADGYYTLTFTNASTSSTFSKDVAAAIKEAAESGKDTAEIAINETIAISSGEVAIGDDSVELTIKRASGFTGTMFSIRGGNVTFNNVTIDGGAVWDEPEKPATRTNSGVVATGQIMRISGGTVTLDADVILQNNDYQNDDTDYADQGSAVYVSEGTFKMNGATIQYNNATGKTDKIKAGDGAAVSVEDGTVNIAGTIKYNYAPRIGGAVRIYQTGNPSVTFGTVEITNNYTSTEYSGGYGAVCLGKDVSLESGNESFTINIDNNYASEDNSIEANVGTNNNSSIVYKSGSFGTSNSIGIYTGTETGDCYKENSVVYKLDTGNSATDEQWKTVKGYFSVDNNAKFEIEKHDSKEKLVLTVIPSKVNVTIGGTTNEYNTLSDALSAITESSDKTGTITLDGDQVLNSSFEIPKGANITLNLNGYKLSADGIAIKNYGKLTVNGKDNVTLKAQGAIVGTTHGIENHSVLVVNGGTIEGKKNDGISNMSDVPERDGITINDGHIIGGNYAVCDYGTNSTNAINGGILEATNGKYYVLGSHMSGKGGTWTIGDNGFTMKSKLQNSWINTANGTGGKAPLVAVTNYDDFNFAVTKASGVYTAVVTKIATNQRPETTMYLADGNIYYTISPAKKNIVRFDFQLYAAPTDTVADGTFTSKTSSAPSGWKHLCFVKSNYTDNMTSEGVTKTEPTTWAVDDDSSEETFTGYMDLSELKPYSGNAASLSQLNSTNPHLWISVNPCHSSNSEFNDFTWVYLGEFNSWSEASRSGSYVTAVDEAEAEIAGMDLPESGDLTKNNLTNKLSGIETSAGAEISSAKGDFDKETLAQERALAKADVVLLAAKLAEKINALEDPEKTTLLNAADKMMDTALDALGNANDQTAIDLALAKAQAKYAVIMNAAEKLEEVKDLDDDTLNSAITTAMSDGINAIDVASDTDAIDKARAQAIAKMDLAVLAAKRIKEINDSSIPQAAKDALIEDVNGMKSAADTVINDNNSTSDNINLALERAKAKDEIIAYAAGKLNADSTTDVINAVKDAVDTACTAINRADVDGLANEVEKGKAAIDKAIVLAEIDAMNLGTETEHFKTLINTAIDGATTALSSATNDAERELIMSKLNAKLELIKKAAEMTADINKLNLSCSNDVKEDIKTELNDAISAISASDIDTAEEVMTVKETHMGEIFVAAYLTDGSTAYTSVNSGNYRQIKSGKDIWNGMSDAEKAAADTALQTLTGESSITCEYLINLAERYGYSDDSSSSSYTKIDITEDIENGSVTTTNKYPAAFTTVVITVTPDDGYELDELTITDAKGNVIEYTDLGNGKYSFRMPVSQVEINAEFKKIGEEKTDDEITLDDFEENSYILLTINDVEAIVFGKKVVNDVAPIIVNERTMLPIRFVAEALGAKVEWNDELKLVTITKGDTVIKIFIGSGVAFVNDVPVELDSAAFIENSRTYLPLRFVAENLGADVYWIEETKQIVIVPVK